MGRSIASGAASGSSAGLAFGEVIELVDGADVIDDLVKANGQLLPKASYPDLAAFTATNTSYAEYTVSNKTALFVRPVSEVENIITFNSNFYCFYESAIDGTMATYWSMSPNGEDWTFPLLVNGSGTFNNVRVLGTSLFIMTSNGTFKYDGTTWSLFNASITKDLAYNGTNIYIGCNSTTTIYKTVDGVAWTTSTVTVDTYSVVWCGTNFLIVGINVNSYYSVDGVSWTLSTLPYTASGFKVLYVNGNAIIPLGSTKLYCYSNNLTSWTQSGAVYSASKSISCFYDGTNYWFGYSGTSSFFYIGKTSTLSIALSSYTFISSSIVGSCKVAYNGTVMLVAGVPVVPNLAFWASSTLPSGNLVINNINPSFDTTWSNTNTFLGNGYYISDVADTGTNFCSFLRVDDGTGLFKLKRYSTSQTYFQTNASSIVFGHYAKDSGYLYYTNTIGATATVTYHKVNSTNILETAGTLTSVRLDGLPFCHNNGFFYTPGTANQSCSVVGNVNYANTVGIAVNHPYSFVTSDGKEILLSQTASPYNLYQSVNYGKSFNIVTPNVYSSAGALVTNNSGIASMYKLGGMYYSYGGTYGGTSPYLLNEIKGLTTLFGGASYIQLNDNLILHATASYVGTKIGSYTVRVGDGVTSKGLAYTHPTTGDIYVLDKTPTKVMKLIKPTNADTTKFKVPNIPSNNNGKANYIKGVK